MAMEGASITWLVLIALSLTSCHFSNVNGKLLNSDYIKVRRFFQTISVKSILSSTLPEQ